MGRKGQIWKSLSILTWTQWGRWVGGSSNRWTKLEPTSIERRLSWLRLAQSKAGKKLRRISSYRGRTKSKGKAQTFFSSRLLRPITCRNSHQGNICWAKTPLDQGNCSLLNPFNLEKPFESRTLLANRAEWVAQTSLFTISFPAFLKTHSCSTPESQSCHSWTSKLYS